MKKIYALFSIMVILLQFANTANLNGQPNCSSYLQHYWKLEEDNLNSFADYAGSLNANVAVNPTRVAGKVGFGQYFNGLSEASLPDDNSFDWSADASFSIEFWMNKSSSCPAQNSDNNNVIIGRDDASTQLHWWAGVSCESPGKINFTLIANNGIGQIIESKRGVIDGQWHHIAIIRDGSLATTSIYIDGTRDSTLSFTYTADFVSVVPINIGWLNLSGKYHYSGSLDELALYNRAISATEITAHYNSGAGMTYCTQNVVSNPAIKILPLGNSLTWDDYVGDVRPASLRISYRRDLFNKLQAAGYKFDFVGSEIAGQDIFPDPENGGFPGINKEQMVTLLQTGYNPRTSIQVINGPYLDYFQPDVILLHIGTNDLTSDITAINQILDIIDAYRLHHGTAVKLLIAKIINRKTYSALTSQYNTNLENAVLQRNNSDNIIVDMENGAGIDYTTDMNDNLHPNPTGYGKMATLWFNTLVTVLGPPPPLTVPATPSGLSALAPTTLSTQLSWTDNASNESGYRIERKTGSGSFSQIAQLPANTIYYEDVGILPSTSYTYRIYAYNIDGNSGYSNQTTVLTPPNPSVITNLAPGKPVLQSSTAYGGIAGRANDDNTSGIWNNGSVSHTGNELSPYWQVDLQALYTINNVEVWNRTDCCMDRLTNYDLFVSDVPFVSGDLNTTLNQSGVWNSFNANYPNPSTAITVNRTGRYVRVQLANQGELSLAEVKVFGNSGPPPVVTLPTAPTSLITQSVTSGSVQLNWTDNASNENGFRIERKTGSNPFSQVVQLNADINSYQDTGLQASTSYTYRVYAFNNAGNSAYSNESTVQTPAVSAVTNLAPGKPVMQSSTAYGGIAGRANDDNTSGIWNNGSVSHTGNELSPYWQVDLQALYTINNVEVWNRTDCCMDRLTNYDLFVSDVPFVSGDLNTTLNQSGVWNSFNANYPNPSTAITVNRTGRYVRVQLANQGELSLAEVKVFGNSGPPPVVTLPTAPTSLITQSVTSGSVQLNWTDNASNENGFRIERKTGSNPFSQVVQLNADINSYQDTGLQASTSYTYRVYAFNNAGNSAYSNESTVQTPAVSAVTNLAPGKPVMQSSTAYGGIAGRANDDNTSGIWNNGSVSHTGNELSPYWQVDLQALYTINNVEVWNRTDCCMDRLTNYDLFVSDVPFVSGDLNTTLNQSGVWNSFNANYPNPSTAITVNRTGRYVRVQLANQGELSLAEVKVFGNSLNSAAKQYTGLFKGEEIGIRMYPNPSPDKVNIEFQVDGESEGSLTIYDMMGRVQKNMTHLHLLPGRNVILWDGSDNGNNPIGSGIYIIRLIINDKVYVQKIVIKKPD